MRVSGLTATILKGSNEILLPTINVEPLVVNDATPSARKPPGNLAL